MLKAENKLRFLLKQKAARRSLTAYKQNELESRTEVRDNDLTGDCSRLIRS